MRLNDEGRDQLLDDHHQVADCPVKGQGSGEGHGEEEGHDWVHEQGGLHGLLLLFRDADG